MTSLILFRYKSIHAALAYAVEILACEHPLRFNMRSPLGLRNVCSTPFPPFRRITLHGSATRLFNLRHPFRNPFSRISSSRSKHRSRSLSKSDYSISGALQICFRATRWFPRPVPTSSPPLLKSHVVYHLLALHTRPIPGMPAFLISVSSRVRSSPRRSLES